VFHQLPCGEGGGWAPPEPPCSPLLSNGVPDFDPSSGLEQLRELIATVAPDEGIEVAGDVGVTSHAGDLLRRAAIPSRLVEAREG
jgi:hypothetical protein